MLSQEQGGAGSAVDTVEGWKYALLEMFNDNGRVLSRERQEALASAASTTQVQGLALELLCHWWPRYWCNTLPIYHRYAEVSMI